MQHRLSDEDTAFRRAFEAFEVHPDAFDHAAHVRLAYTYLCDGPVEAAVDRMRRSLLAFLDHLGASPARYHETMTRAWVMAVHRFMDGSPACASAAEFARRNPVLLDRSIMLTHYSAEVLFSPEARAAFVAPDVQPIRRTRV
ncbi:MAG: hypothetical protein R3247_15485 [Rhodothermales bacterium]|nr:hypothetical protein [Rhodothermales bacterium]